MQEMTREQYSKKCLDSTRLYLTIYHTLLNTKNRDLILNSIIMLPTTLERRDMFSRMSLPHFIQREDGSEKHSNKLTDFQLRILTNITIEAWKLARVTCKRAAKQAGLNYSETVRAESRRYLGDKNERH